MISVFSILLAIMILGTCMYLVLGSIGGFLRGLFGHHFVSNDGLILELIRMGFFQKRNKLSRYTNKRISRYIKKCSYLPGFNDKLLFHGVRSYTSEEARVMGINVTPNKNYLIYLNNFIEY